MVYKTRFLSFLIASCYMLVALVSIKAMAFLVTEFLTLLIIVCLLLLLSGVWPPDSPWAPWWQMPNDVIKKMCQMAKISSKDTIYDLGCGTGRALIYASLKVHVRGVGIEIDPIRAFLATWNVRRFKQQEKITILKKNFFDVNLAPATIIFVYLVPAALKRLTPKFLQELKPQTKFLSYVYPLQEELFNGRLKLIEHDTKMRIFYYKLKG